MPEKLEVESWEDRSGQDPKSYNPALAFGYVYFNDGNRVGFSLSTTDTPPVWHARTNGGGKANTTGDKHIRMATEFLRGEGLPA